MQIDKIIIIDSPVHLWRILRTKEEILDQSKDDVFFSLNLFMDSVNIYINGCKCDEEENYTDMINQYISIQSENIVSHLLNCLECDRIEFN
jgi:hypothetical protein